MAAAHLRRTARLAPSSNLGAGTGSVYARYIGRVGALAVALGVTERDGHLPGGGVGRHDDGWTDSSSTSTGTGTSSPAAGGTTTPSTTGEPAETGTPVEDTEDDLSDEG